MSTEADQNIAPNAGGSEDQDKNQGGKKAKVTFSAEQQEVVDAIVDRIFGKALDKGKGEAKSEYETKLTEYETKLTALSTKLEELSKPKGDEEDAGKGKKKAATPDPELEQRFGQLNARLEEVQNANKALLAEKTTLSDRLKAQEESQVNTRIEREFLQAAKKIDFIDPDQVLTLLKGQIVFDKELNSVVAMNPRTGRPRMDDTMENPLALDAFLSTWANENKHHLRAPDPEGGTGAGGSRRQDVGKKAAKSFADMTPEEFQAYSDSIMAKAYQ